MENHLVITRIKMVPMCCPPRGIAVYLDVTATAFAIRELQHGVLKVWPSMQIPPPRGSAL